MFLFIVKCKFPEIRKYNLFKSEIVFFSNRNSK